MADSTLETPAAPVFMTNVPWRVYRDLRLISEMRNRRMTYLDGTLFIMSPEFIHEETAELLGQVFRAVASASRIKYRPVGRTTLWRKGRARLKGNGKEPDGGFYVGATAVRMRGKTTIDLAVDPPPDLVIEVDNKADSHLALPLYANLGVPEVWVYNLLEESLWFGWLADDAYDAIERSECLPRLTPGRVLQALSTYDREDEGAWNDWLRKWARRFPDPA